MKAAIEPSVTFMREFTLNPDWVPRIAIGSERVREQLRQEIDSLCNNPSEIRASSFNIIVASIYVVGAPLEMVNQWMRIASIYYMETGWYRGGIEYALSSNNFELIAMVPKEYFCVETGVLDIYHALLRYCFGNAKFSPAESERLSITFQVEFSTLRASPELLLKTILNFLNSATDSDFPNSFDFEDGNFFDLEATSLLSLVNRQFLPCIDLAKLYPKTIYPFWEAIA
jgi:hypothetical protein